MTDSIVQLMDNFAQDQHTYKMYKYRVHVCTVSVRVYINRITRKSYGYIHAVPLQGHTYKIIQSIHTYTRAYILYVRTLKATATRRAMNILSYRFALH